MARGSCSRRVKCWPQNGIKIFSFFVTRFVNSCDGAQREFVRMCQPLTSCAAQLGKLRSPKERRGLTRSCFGIRRAGVLSINPGGGATAVSLCLSAQETGTRRRSYKMAASLEPTG